MEQGVLVLLLSTLSGVLVGGALTMLGSRFAWRRESRLGSIEKVVIATEQFQQEVTAAVRAHPGAKPEDRRPPADELTRVREAGAQLSHAVRIANITAGWRLVTANALLSALSMIAIRELERQTDSGHPFDDTAWRDDWTKALDAVLRASRSLLGLDLLMMGPRSFLALRRWQQTLADVAGSEEPDAWTRYLGHRS